MGSPHVISKRSVALLIIAVLLSIGALSMPVTSFPCPSKPDTDSSIRTEAHMERVAMQTASAQGMCQDEISIVATGFHYLALVMWAAAIASVVNDFKTRRHHRASRGAERERVRRIKAQRSERVATEEKRD